MKLLALVVLAVVASAEEAPLPRPKDLPKNVPADAVIKRHPGHGDGGLIEIRWDHSMMLWAEPCRTKETAKVFAVEEKTFEGCAMAVDMQVRPMYYGTLDRKATRKALKAGAKKPCCYRFETLGNR